MPKDAAIARQNIRIQKYVTVVAVILFAIKFFAWYTTRSMAIYTDTLESIVNIISGFFGLYSLYFSAQPRDEKHPYGHGKIEFISAAIEGGFVTFAGVMIIFKVIASLGAPHVLERLDQGIILILITAVANFAIGTFSIRYGKRNKSLALIASGKHLQTDTWSTIGIIVGLVVVAVTGYGFLDSIVALLFGGLIIYSGVIIIREAISGILDAADPELIRDIVAFINLHRRPNWIDLHNLRIIKYGRILHIDAHMTVPGNLTVTKAHEEQEVLAALIREKFGHNVELFIHLDPAGVGIASTEEDWTVENVLRNRGHRF
ncbi:MAG: cation diffusion facilitator family transporter [Alphaproteobacteria bacterium]|nr:cation diffusion facilitator family transporter [Alphaproteobacteria bacterium]